MFTAVGPAIGAAIGAAATIAVAMVTLAHQQRAARRDAQQKLMSELGNRLIAGLAEQAHRPSRESLANFTAAKLALLTYSPPPVVEALAAWDRTITDATPTGSESALNSLIGAIRVSGGLQEISEADARQVIFGY